MNDKQIDDDKSSDEFVEQDGCRIPRKAPWSPWVGRLTTLPFVVMFCLGFFILFNTSTITLIVWLAVVVLSIVPGRYFLCARCPYYGQNCSTRFGRLVPYLFKKIEGKSMKAGLWLDLTEMFLLFVIPLPFAWRLGGIVLLLFWIGANFLSFGALTRIACPSCDLSFCPIGRIGGAIWGKSS